MVKKGKQRSVGDERRNLYAEVTDRIIAELEAGRLPWVQPWGNGNSELELPKNAATRRAYAGINILVLWGAVIEGGYPSQLWLTFRQALTLGGSVRKGERGTTVFYADRFIPKEATERALETGEEPGAVAFLKRFTVFNVAQIDGLPEDAATSSAPLPEREIIFEAEALIAATEADFRIGGDRAFYAPSADFIQVPPQPAFFEQINYYRTAFHELGHWTGHSSRLNRDLAGTRGSDLYAREELVAELSSAFLCASLRIVPIVRHADYLGSWLQVLREDNRAIFRAASQASKAADFILNFRGNRPGICTAQAPSQPAWVAGGAS